MKGTKLTERDKFRIRISHLYNCASDAVLSARKVIDFLFHLLYEQTIVESCNEYGEVITLSPITDNPKFEELFADKLILLAKQTIKEEFDYALSSIHPIYNIESRCEVSNIYSKGTHKYHLISQDGKGVYGWVNASDVEGAEIPAPSGGNTTVKVGDIVQFKGGNVYISADASTASAVRGASRCKVTITNSGKHPYHLVSVDGKGVYGWVDSANVTK